MSKNRIMIQKIRTVANEKKMAKKAVITITEAEAQLTSGQHIDVWVIVV